MEREYEIRLSPHCIISSQSERGRDSMGNRESGGNRGYGSLKIID